MGILRSDFDERMEPFLKERRLMTAKILEVGNELETGKEKLEAVEIKVTCVFHTWLLFNTQGYDRRMSCGCIPCRRTQ